MKKRTQTIGLAGCLVLALAGRVGAQDWTQWRGANRDAKVAGFNAPKTWPKTLTQKWKVTVGEGVATPALVGDRLYVFSRQDGTEVLRALEASTGKEIWQEKYEALGASGPAQGFSGPRSSPAVANGKVVTLGVRGMLSCVDAATGRKLWRKDDFQAYPRFHPSSSPVILDGMCIAQLGGSQNGALVAYDLTSGEQKWKWTGPSPSYASPALMTVAGTKIVVAQTETKLVAVAAADGKLLWESTAPAPGGGGGGGGGAGGGPGGRGGAREYKASTPIVDGQTLISAGRGIKAVKFEKGGDGLVGKELWNNAEKSVQFSSPVLKDGLIYGLTGGNEIFCINAQNGQLAWSAPASAPDPARAERSATGEPGGPGEQGGPGGPGGRGRGGRGGGGGYGSLVDAGSVLLALTPASELIVFQPGDKAYKELARIKVAETPTHAYPVLSGNRVFIKDKESVTLWSVE